MRMSLAISIFAAFSLPLIDVILKIRLKLDKNTPGGQHCIHSK
jgi:hypothetical protein